MNLYQGKFLPRTSEVLRMSDAQIASAKFEEERRLFDGPPHHRTKVMHVFDTPELAKSFLDKELKK